MSKEITKEMVHEVAVRFVDKFQGPWTLAQIEKALVAEFLPEEYNVQLFDDSSDPADVQLKVSITDEFVSIEGTVRYIDAVRRKFWKVNRQTKQVATGSPALSVKRPSK